MSYIFSQQVAREQLHLVVTFLASKGLYPEKVLHIGVCRLADRARCFVKVSNLFPEPKHKFICGFTIRYKVKMFNLLTDYPIGHRINVVSENVTTDSICFQQRSTTPHEWICDLDSTQII